MFQEESYHKHGNWYNSLFPTEESKKAFFQKFKDAGQNTINTWLQSIQFSCLDPLISKPGLSWLTVGDAYGLDANYIISKGNDNLAHASDLQSDFLKISHQEGFITGFSAENAERLSFEDNSFDYVLCKETYHHFPRPYMAVYEMLRVAKKGVMMIEPQDPVTKMPVFLFVANILAAINDKLVQKVWKNRFSYEPVGNFVYKVSEREFEKLAAGLNLRLVAFKRINSNFYYKGAESTMANPGNRKFQKLKIKKRILDLLVSLKLCSSQVLTSLIFKETPHEQEQQQLKNAGYHLVHIPKNPYL
jgi:ubiquinone/menaquinone biosynthesis C-methylase UbiE